jgi:signal transduction histidine kinase
MTPLGRYVRTRLNRRIFAWFSGGLMTMGVLVAAIMMLVGRVQEPLWARTFDNGRHWLGHQFARDWNDPVARAQFAEQAATDLDAFIELSGPTGERLLLIGQQCGEHHVLQVPVERDGQVVGHVTACLAHPPNPGWQWGLMTLLGVLAVWVASGRVARRLARPLDDLAEVVRKIGEGDLKARADLHCNQPDEIGVVAEAVNDMAARIEKQMADQRELLATVSHELRTPLARLRIISEIARDTGSTPKTFDDLDREVVEMDSLVGDLLASSRVDFGQVSRRTLSLRDLATEAVERAGLAPEKLRINGDGDRFEGDPTLLHRALANLLDNARKHAGGVEALEITIDSARVRFEVLDRGPGFTGPPDALFRKFTKGEHGADSGLGLGLALVKRIAEAHGGTVFATGRDGGGASFGFHVLVAQVA